MPSSSFDLTKLDSNSFEHLANMLALKVLGYGHTGFGPGQDGGRDGYFRGSAPYPSTTDRWDGTWYIQSKFLAPRLSVDPQKWLLERIQQELDEFVKPDTRRKWPTNWIIVTNIDPSGVPETGGFDKALELVSRSNPALKERFAIWGGRKVLDILAVNPDIARYYGEFLTPGHVIAELHRTLTGKFAATSELSRYLIVTQFEDQQYTRLEQAGSDGDNRPGVHHLFVDVPYHNAQSLGMAAADLTKASAKDQRCNSLPDNTADWQRWQRDPRRARIWFVKGGPGQGKSTLSQYYCQIQRAALIIGSHDLRLLPRTKTLADEVRAVAMEVGMWPAIPRIPISLELKEYAHWFGQMNSSAPRGVLSYICSRLTAKLSSELQVGTLKEALSSSRWAVIFDGMDEVPSDVKDLIAEEVNYFVNDVLIELNTDVIVVCTSRPQGYSGQFSALEPAQVNLIALSPEQALACAKPILQIGRSEEESKKSFELLRDAVASPGIREIMQSPLQSHIMAVVVRDGERPPEQKWNLFSHFYRTIKRREANRNLPDKDLAKLLREGDKLLKAVHNRLGFELHYQAETSDGAATSMPRGQLQKVLREIVRELQDDHIEETVTVLARATTERLVLVSTPENSEGVRFDVRQFQEFFAAEYISDPRENGRFLERLSVIVDDSHWREVTRFLLAGLIENERWQELSVAIQCLSDTDEGGGYQDNAELGHALALGARLAGQLIQEGVLEADRRVRQQFRSLLLPLVSSTDSWPLLSGVKPIHTKTWLLGILVDEIRNRKTSSNIGAAAALALSEITDPEVTKTYADEVLTADSSYKDCFMGLVGRHFVYTSRELSTPQWLVELIVRLFLQDTWYDLGEGTLRVMLRLLSTNTKKVPEALMKAGVSEEASHFLGTVMGEEETDVRQRSDATSTLHFGLLEVVDFKLKKPLDLKLISDSCWRDLSKITGVFSIIYAILRLVKDRSPKALAGYLGAIEGKPNVGNLMPVQVRAFLNLEMQPVASPTTIEGILSPDFSTYRDFFLTAHRAEVDWAKAAAEQPALLLHMLHRPEAFQVGASLEGFIKGDGIRSLYHQMDANPKMLMEHVGAWEILTREESLLHEEFRALLLRASALPVVEDWIGARGSKFQVRLPEEVTLLPHLLAHFVRSMNEEFDYATDSEDLSISLFIEELRGMIGRTVPDVDRLSGLLNRIEVKRRDRAAAIMMMYLHPNRIASVALPPPSIFVDLWDESEAVWYLPAVAITLTPDVKALTPSSLQTIGRLISLARNNYAARLALDPVIQGWREFSRAPVHTRSKLDLWK